jgi:hypothetical protein
MKSIIILVCSLSFLGILACAKKDQDDDCLQNLSKKIKVGALRNEAEKVLDQCAFTHSFDQRTSTIFGLKHYKNNGITKQDWSVEIKIDSSEKVASINVKKVYTGP